MTARLTALVLATALLGFVVGARAVGPVPAAEPSASAAGVREIDPLRGSFWRPAGSDAARPAPSLEPVAWRPASAEAPRPRAPRAIASLQAIVRLSALE